MSLYSEFWILQSGAEESKGGGGAGRTGIDSEGRILGWRIHRSRQSLSHPISNLADALLISRHRVGPKCPSFPSFKNRN